MKTITTIIYLAFAMLALVCFGLSPIASAATTETIPAITPTPDGCYPGFNTAEGCQALLNINTAAGQGNTGLGFAALKFLTSGDNNTAVGRGALQSNNASGETAVGFGALASNTTGGTAGGGGIAQFGPNTAVGTEALASNTIGNSNTAVGFAALGSNTTGNFSTAVGFRALASSRVGSLGSNCAFGYKALEATTTGNFNVSVGNLSLSKNTDGDDNTAIGQYAGFAHVHGDRNVYIGNGSQGLATESRHTYIDNVGQTAQPTSAGVVDFVTVNLASNLLGHTASSRRYKEDIKAMDKASEVIYRLEPVIYHYNKEIDPNQNLDYGLVAEDVAKIDSKLAIRDGKGQIESVRYMAIYNMMLNEFLKEHQKVQKLEAALAAVTERLKEQDAKIDKVNAKIELTKPAPQTVLNN